MPEYVKPRHLINAYLHSCKRAREDMLRVAAAPELPESTRQLARQSVDLLEAVYSAISPKESSYE